MSTKIFVGRLADGTVSDDLTALFRKFGTVTECAIMGNYGFVHMSTETEARAAIADLDGYSVRGSHIHVELSTPNTQGRKKRSTESSDRGGRYEPYPPARTESFYTGGGGHRVGSGGGMSAPPDRGAERSAAAPSREEYASEQVKDLLELYFRDPYAFDQYAKTYYYGERAERERARAFYDRRIPESDYASKSSSYAPPPAIEPSGYSSRSMPSVGLSDRYRGGGASYSGRI